MNSSKNQTVKIEKTPNPSTLKFEIQGEISHSSVEFNDVSEAIRSPLATKLFGFPWMEKVFIGPNFISITKQDWVEWEVLALPLAHLIEDHIQRGEPVLLELKSFDEDEIENRDEEIETSNESLIIKKIKKLLNQEIRPVVALDGGDISFVHFENGQLQVEMKGACAGCPSSMATLKEGVEARMKQVIPEVKEVISV